MMSGVMIRQEGYDIPVANNGMFVHITPGMSTDETTTIILSTESK